MKKPSTFIQAQQAFTNYLRKEQNSTNSNNGRAIIYKNLIYNNIENILTHVCPILHSILPTAQWETLIQNFIAEHGCKKPLFYEIAEEFLTYLYQIKNDASEWSYIKELAHYEWIELALDFASDDISDIAVNQQGELLHNIPILSPLAVLLNYQYPVHKANSATKLNAVSASHTQLIAYRNRNDEVHFIEINLFTARLFILLQTRQYTGLEALKKITTESNHPNLETVIAGGLHILLNLAQHDIVLGTAIT